LKEALRANVSVLRLRGMAVADVCRSWCAVGNVYDTPLVIRGDSCRAHGVDADDREDNVLVRLGTALGADTTRNNNPSITEHPYGKWCSNQRPFASANLWGVSIGWREFIRTMLTGHGREWRWFPRDTDLTFMAINHFMVP